jgi:hypothetical protein
MDSAKPERPGDTDVNVRALLVFMAWLTIGGVAVVALVWALAVRLKTDLAASDPLPSPVVAARATREPSGPRLEEAPPRNLAELRAREDAELAGWGWVDAERRVARIPIERAMEIIAEKGLPPPPPMRPAPTPAPPEGGKK